MKRLRRIWDFWMSSAIDSAQQESDASILQEYADVCEEQGADSIEAKRLESHVAAIHARRNTSVA
jgi:hypothetical protein